MIELTGHWTGIFSGTLNGGVTLELSQNGETLSGRGKFQESSLGVQEFSIEGRTPPQSNEVLLILKPGPAAPPQFGTIEVRGRLAASGQIAGKWVSSPGPEGAFSLNRTPEDSSAAPGSSKPSVFIVHGHDEATKEKVARVIEKLGLAPIILHEQISRSMTVVEKFERYASQSSFAIAVFTPDDVGYRVPAPEEKRSRARQNVVLELGYFFGKLGRSRVAVLCKGDLELPTDIGGLVYTRLDEAGAWRYTLVKELRDAGIPVDANRLADL